MQRKKKYRTEPEAELLRRANREPFVPPRGPKCLCTERFVRPGRHIEIIGSVFASWVFPGKRKSKLSDQKTSAVFLIDKVSNSVSIYGSDNCKKGPPQTPQGGPAFSGGAFTPWKKQSKSNNALKQFQTQEREGDKTRSKSRSNITEE